MKFSIKFYCDNEFFQPDTKSMMDGISAVLRVTVKQIARFGISNQPRPIHDGNGNVIGCYQLTGKGKK